jgi:hypothetical protein
MKTITSKQLTKADFVKKCEICKAIVLKQIKYKG